MEWDGTRSDDGGGVGGVALGWVFTVEGGARVRVHRDGRGVMRGGRNESGKVGIGESLTVSQKRIRVRKQPFDLIQMQKAQQSS